MFASLKKNAVKISIATAAIIAGALGLAYAFPAQVAAAASTVMSGIRGAFASVTSLFRRDVDMTVSEPMPASPAAA